MRVLVACEFSGIVRTAFRERGHEAYSCDIIDAEDGSQFHLLGDVNNWLAEGWDLMIAHPPCTYLCSSGLHWNKRVPGREAKTNEALAFVHRLLDAPIPHIALENPIGCISTSIRKPDQMIQPWMFGEDASKNTCLWLKGLPQLQPTLIVEHHFGCGPCGKRYKFEAVCPTCEQRNRKIWGNQTPSGQNKLGPSDTRWMERSRTYHGIAKAMAAQWGGV